MMHAGDDMTMRVRLKHDTPQRERAAEERRSRQTEGKQRKARRRIRKSRAIRQEAARRMRKRRSKAKSSNLKHLKKLKYAKRGSRAIPILGWAMLANDAALLYHEFGRRISGGMSARLVQTHDDQLVYGDMLPQAASAAAAIDYVESDIDILRTTGERGKMSGTVTANVAIIRRLAYERAVGADMIRRDQHFDSADSLLDKIIMQAERAELKSMADRTAHLIRQRGGRGIK